MSVRDLIGDRELSSDAPDELQEVLQRHGVPEDIKRRYMLLRGHQVQLEQQLDDTSRTRNHLREQIQTRKRREQELEMRLIYNEKPKRANHSVLDNDINSFLQDANVTATPRQVAVYIIALDQGFEDTKRSLDFSLTEWIIYPAHGLVPPDRFIAVAVAEESGLIVPIGTWVLYSASSLLTAWTNQQLNSLFVTVNVSPRQLKDEYLLSNIQGALGRAGVAADNLRLEITESSMMDEAENSLYKIHRIREMDIQAAIDDFGTGYSSLSYLKRFPIRAIDLKAWSTKESSYGI